MEWREYFMIEGLSFFMIQVLVFDIHSLTPASDKVIKNQKYQFLGFILMISTFAPSRASRADELRDICVDTIDAILLST